MHTHARTYARTHTIHAHNFAGSMTPFQIINITSRMPPPQSLLLKTILQMPVFHTHDLYHGSVNISYQNDVVNNE